MLEGVGKRAMKRNASMVWALSDQVQVDFGNVNSEGEGDVADSGHSGWSEWSWRATSRIKTVGRMSWRRNITRSGRVFDKEVRDASVYRCSPQKRLWVDEDIWRALIKQSGLYSSIKLSKLVVYLTTPMMDRFWKISYPYVTCLHYTQKDLTSLSFVIPLVACMLVHYPELIHCLPTVPAIPTKVGLLICTTDNCVMNMFQSSLAALAYADEALKNPFPCSDIICHSFRICFYCRIHYFNYTPPMFVIQFLYQQMSFFLLVSWHNNGCRFFYCFLLYHYFTLCGTLLCLWGSLFQRYIFV